MTSKVLKKSKFLYISLLIICIDQFTKYIAINYLEKEVFFTFIPKVIGFRLVKNYGAAFSLLSNSSSLLALISLATSIFLVVYLAQLKDLTLLKGLAIGFILGGSIGNGIDRWSYGYVYDFIEIMIIQFPIFNIADISINIGVLFLILNHLRNNKGRH